MHENLPHPDPVRPRISKRLVLAVVLGAVALLAAACGGGDGGASASSGGGKPSVTITAPAADATVGTSFQVKMDLSFPIGKPDTGRQHIHLHYDDSSQYDIAYSDTHTAKLPPGKHTIVAVVANADHTETDVRSAPVTVQVGNDPATSADTPTTSGGGVGY